MLSDNILFNMYLLFATLFIYILPLFIFKKQDYFSIIYEIMPITIDYQLREQITHEASVFPITYFHNELATLLNWEGPLHWHPEFEIATAVSGILTFKWDKNTSHGKPETAYLLTVIYCMESDRYPAMYPTRCPISSFPILYLHREPV